MWHRCMDKSALLTADSPDVTDKDVTGFQPEGRGPPQMSCFVHKPEDTEFSVVEENRNQTIFRCNQRI